MALAQGIPLHYCIAAAQGHRSYMEDTYTVGEIHNKRMLFAIFDGHGGQCAAKYSATHVIELCKQHLRGQAFTHADIDGLLLTMDQDVCLECPPTCGATALLMFADKEHLHFANCGDSMAVVYDHSGIAHMVSQEHKVENEKARIRAAGGTITYDDGVARINRQLNVSRSLGDAHLKEYVTSDPYQYVFPLKQANLVIMASDGLWDVYTSSELAEDIKNYEDTFGTTEEAQVGLPSWLITRAINHKGSTDNITVITVRPGQLTKS